MVYFKYMGALLLWMINIMLIAQTEKSIQNQLEDSLHIYEVEQKKVPVKILHAEPLYIDLIRDLGARKGEKEWNLGVGASGFVRGLNLV